MFTTLLESRAPRTRRFAGTVVSALIHGALIAGAVLVTLPRSVDANPEPRTPPEVFWIPILHPPEPPRRQLHDVLTSEPGTRLPAEPISITFRDRPSVDIDVGPTLVDHEILERGGVDPATPIGWGARNGVAGDGHAWEANQVDRPPALAGGAIQPRYPASLHAAGIEGRVVLQFVVDTLGRAEPGSVSVIEASHTLFAEAVREVLPRYRFMPGEAGGHRVRTRVQIPFDFVLERR
jgi:protein TonB